MEKLYTLTRGNGPVLVSVPHAGRFVPDDIEARFSATAKTLPDTDWFVDRLYDFAPAMGAGLLAATHSRYVIDLNRPPDGAALYATRTTGLLPLETFGGQAIYQPGQAPVDPETAERCERYWLPYHEALSAELQRICAAHGHAVLLDAHSIRSRVPLLFEGLLPDLNLGTNDGRSSAANLITAAMGVLSSDPDLSSVLDGRFRGGYITRHYGRPADGVHALQLEMTQCTYMQETPPKSDPESLASVRKLLGSLLQTLMGWRPGHA